MKELCICGHLRKQHKHSDVIGKTFCLNCLFNSDIHFKDNLNLRNWEHKFQLDNLDYIEQEAKRRGLI